MKEKVERSDEGGGRVFFTLPGWHSGVHISLTYPNVTFGLQGNHKQKAVLSY